MNQDRCTNQFLVSEKVLLKVDHIKLASLVKQPSRKLQLQYISPYKIKQIISPVAYKLELPDNLCIHLVFHMALLKRYIKPMNVEDHVPPELVPEAISMNGHWEFKVEEILD